jgi:hypothetical protein
MIAGDVPPGIAAERVRLKSAIGGVDDMANGTGPATAEQSEHRPLWHVQWRFDSSSRSTPCALTE